MTSTAITWKQSQYSVKYGYVGKTRVFSTVFGMERNSATPWKLQANLPGIKKTTEHATETAAQEAAETMLRIHLNSLIKAGVQAPQEIDAALDPQDLEQAAQAIARVAIRHEYDGFDEATWQAFWAALAPAERLRYRLKAQAAMKA